MVLAFRPPTLATLPLWPRINSVFSQGSELDSSIAFRSSKSSAGTARVVAQFDMAVAEPIRPERVLDQLADGSAWFEYVETEEWDIAGAPFASISAAFSSRRKRPTSFFARIAPLGGGHHHASHGTSPAMKKVEYHSVRRISGDGRCMFRALVVGMATNKGQNLSYMEEEQEADQLRLAVMDAICTPDQRSHIYEEALIAITVEESLKRYCQRIPSPSFWGGESELLVLSKMCCQPIIVYIPESEAKNRGYRGGGGYIPIAEYGSDYKKPGKDRKARKPVRLLYSGSNHYDLLI
ncbi:hypothetical protein Mp_5g10040 [Marchantia polymorpha subsp. ruderalis]|uniref:Ubiquitin thioesterase OTU n=2 Tax=Marchantia polymorpha TaxID=3197 RepID=A0AAF6BGS9_MARPO|nr:hypothetical protein MARPO_0048s0067 [Marchantia polymorpha]BBN11213.1 hypothetical protein Mp_5g10040 [Marchantia polymorpha subsp. ruderalis]|eukprot:PTQ38957.1 hypothetical protein MARPO_0048s0067 [Marchantia polymorpha]